MTYDPKRDDQLLVPYPAVLTDPSQPALQGRGAPGGKRPRRSAHLSPTATIFGAGIAGLSAAHELIERGFSVQVVESATSPHEEYDVEVGGLARNQFGRVPENPNALHAHAEEETLVDKPKAAKPGAEQSPGSGGPDKFRDNIDTVFRLRARGMQAVQPRFGVPWRIGFDRSRPEKDRDVLDTALRDEWGVQNEFKLRAAWETLKAAYQAYLPKGEAAGRRTGPPGAENDQLPQDWIDREVLSVEIRGHTDADFTEFDNREQSERWATRVKEYLGRLNQDEGGYLPNFNHHFRPVGVGSAEPLGDRRDESCRKRSNRVEFRIVEQLIPGEHGYRFFPAFYRHLFDTMRRTPMLDGNGHATGQTAFERLMPTTDLGLAIGDGRPPASLQTKRVGSVEELRKLSELFLGRLGVTHRDIVRFQTRLLKFLTSSSERRSREYENQSWWQFLGGDDERGYSPKMRQYLMETSQALVAMNAEETDARSQGNIVSQLQLHYLKDASDFTLNGPTSDVWLRPWKTYLKRQGVRFFVGELAALEWKQDDETGLEEMIPVTAHRSGWLTPAPPAGPKLRGMSRSPEVLAARPARRKIEVRVLGSDDGDYIIVVAGVTYCCTARGRTREQIAGELATQIERNDKLWVRRIGARLVIREGSCHRLSTDRDHDFDMSAEPGAWMTSRRITEQALKGDVASRAQALNERVDKHRAALDRYLRSAAAGRKETAASALHLRDDEWVAAGRLRAEDPAFEDKLAKLEDALNCEIVPCFSFDAERADVTVKPGRWAAAALEAQMTADGRRARLLCPYNFRFKESSEHIWFKVSNAHDNLRIVDEPVPENPNHNYLAPTELPPAFRPDFYVLALPLQQASRIVWRAESDEPGKLHGCLAELLEFDRRTYRRTTTGEVVRPIRDVNGRPPFEYPLRDFAGIQYYFHNHVRIGKGHIYFPQAEWGLSSISQLAYWRERMSPAGAFMGQLSVDIGDFYKRAAVRRGRLSYSAWNSSAAEIAEEVWFQVRQALERDRAGVLSAPSCYHIDQGLSFRGPLGSTFRGEARIVIRAAHGQQPYTVWVQRLPFQAQPETPEVVAEKLAAQIRDAFPGVLAVTTESAAAHDFRLKICSTVPQGSALILCHGRAAGRFDVLVGEKSYSYANLPTSRRRWSVRDGLLARLLRDPHPGVAAEPIGRNRILLVPTGGSELPPVRVFNGHQQLDVVFGTMLHLRLEQSNGALSFEQSEGATIGDNQTPFLINLPGQWQYRPGLFKPSDLTFEDTILRPRRTERVRYRISNRRWVAAGTYMATTTQLTTMESANESARHAVNAILRCLAFRPGEEYNSQGRVFADLAEVWDPEMYEIEDLEPLKRLDRKLVEEGLPHVMDILQLTEAIDAMPMHGQPSADPLANAIHLLQHLADGTGKDWGFAKQTLNDLFCQLVERARGGVDPAGILRDLQQGSSQAVDRIREFLQSMRSRPDQPSGGGTPAG